MVNPDPTELSETYHRWALMSIRDHLTPVAASFRDPRGRVYDFGGRIFRTVGLKALPDLEFVLGTGLLDDLARDYRLVPWRRLDPDALPFLPAEDAAAAFEAERLDTISYPYEWSFAGLKAAALLHLDIHNVALERGVTLTDASAYNIQFAGPRPVFIDHLSFRPYREGEIWRAHLQFCEQFLNPLLVQAKVGLPHNILYRGHPEGLPTSVLKRLLPWSAILSTRTCMHVYLPQMFESRSVRKGEIPKAVHRAKLPRSAFGSMLAGLRTWIERLEPKYSRASAWSRYTGTESYSREEYAAKARFVHDFVRSTAPLRLWDAGCNTGEYASIALEAGAGLVVGLEKDSVTLEAAFRRAVDERLNFLPLHQDLLNPSPGLGWNECEHDALRVRANADAVLALAILHHLVVGGNVPLSDAVEWLVGIAPRGIIEFVPRDDPMVRRMLALREDGFPDYSRRDFHSALDRAGAVVRRKEKLSGGRHLVWYERNPTGAGARVSCA